MILSTLALWAHYAIFVSKKIVEVEPSWYADYAFDLHLDQTWRIGFQQGHHGATFVKTRNVPSADPAQSPRSNEPRQILHSEDLPPLMRTTLAQIPLLTKLEALFYVLLAASATLIAPMLWWITTRNSTSELRRTVGAAVAVLVVVTVAVSPLLLFHHGGSLYSTWAGPYPYSFSGPLTFITFTPGNTISYRTFIEAFAYLPWRAVNATNAITRHLRFDC
ncbi:MAG: hypothetical protein ACC655_09120 [Rhodothermia bacterium]